MSFKKSKNFVRDKDIGNKGEQLLIELLAKVNIVANKNTDRQNFQFWDVATEKTSFEVKYDMYSAHSGNIAIEFFNPKSGKLSGLTATKAVYWVQVLPDNTIWICEVEDLKKFCAETSPLKVIAAGGDDNSSMYIYQKHLILGPLFVMIDEKNILSILGV